MTYYLTLAEEQLNSISTNELRRSVYEHILGWTGVSMSAPSLGVNIGEYLDYTETKLYKFHVAKAKKEAMLEGLREIREVSKPGYNWFSGWTTKLML